MVYFDEDGKEVEGVLSAEEVETQKTEAIDKYKEENPGDETLKTSLEEKETALKEKEEELEKEKGKEKNFAKLREKAKAAGVELDEKDVEFSQLRDETKKEIAELRNEVSTGKRTEAIDKLSDDDQEAFESNLKDAYFLTTKQEVQVPDYISSAGAGGGKQKDKDELSDGAKSMAQRLNMGFIKSNK